MSAMPGGVFNDLEEQTAAPSNPNAAINL